MMLANLEVFAQLFEAAMLICFGLSWPISILKSWRIKFVRGKSPAFLSLIFFGYLSGITYKLLDAWVNNTPPEWTTSLYALNAVFVATDLVLYARYRHNLEPATQDVARDIAALNQESDSQEK
jgi:hypothetical protein